MSRIFLLRHAHSQANAKGILAGRMEGIALSDNGREQLAGLSKRLENSKFDLVISSPLQRCLETISQITADKEIAEEFTEVHYGDWTGRRMASLARNKAWKEIHRNPASVRFPNGETLPEVQTRALLGLDLRVKPRSRNLLISTHADVVKVLVMHALGTHLNNIDKLQIDNASISVIDKNGSDLRVVKVNDSASSIAELLI